MYLVFSGRHHSPPSDMTADAEVGYPKQVAKAGRSGFHSNETSVGGWLTKPHQGSPLSSAREATKLKCPLHSGSWLPGNNNRLE